MPRRMKDLLAQRALENIVGRTKEMAFLLQCLEDECPLVMHIHGIGGVGKSALVQAFSAQAQEQGATVVILDSPLIEPTERGFLHELGNAIGLSTPTIEDVVNKLESLPEPETPFIKRRQLHENLKDPAYDDPNDHTLYPYNGTQ